MSRDVIVEMFRNGNVILLDQDGFIIQPLTHVKYETRTIKRGEPYVAPPEPMDPRTLSETQFHSVLKKSDRDLVHTLAGKMSLGSAYAQALCSLSGLNPSQPASEVDSAERLHQVSSSGSIRLMEKVQLHWLTNPSMFPRTLLNWML